jgi:hypothetical protein
VFLRTALGQPPRFGVFFTVGGSAFQLRNPVGDLDKFLGELLKSLVVGHIHFGLLGLIGRDAFGALAALQIALQNEIRSLTNLLPLHLSGEELFAQRTASKSVDGLDLLKDSVPFATEFGDRQFHGLYIVSTKIQYQAQNRPVIGSVQNLVTLASPAR